MYQHTNDNQKFNSIADIFLVVALILLIAFIGKLSQLFSTMRFGGVMNVLMIMFVVGACYFIYRRRLCSYRYTIFYEQPPEGELDEFGKQLTQPYPLGSILFERMTGGRGKLYEGVAAYDFVALMAPGKKYSEKIGFLNYSKITVYSVKTAHTLIFRRKGKLYGIYFHPNEEFVACMAKSPLDLTNA